MSSLIFLWPEYGLKTVKVVFSYNKVAFADMIRKKRRFVIFNGFLEKCRLCCPRGQPLWLCDERENRVLFLPFKKWLIILLLSVKDFLAQILYNDTSNSSNTFRQIKLKNSSEWVEREAFCRGL